MLKDARYEKRKFRGLFMYPKHIMKGEPLKLEKPNTHIFFCTYDIPDSAELRKYIGYFNHMNANSYDLTFMKYKHLPIKEPNA